MAQTLKIRLTRTPLTPQWEWASRMTSTQIGDLTVGAACLSPYEKAVESEDEAANLAILSSGVAGHNGSAGYYLFWLASRGYISVRSLCEGLATAAK